MIEIVTKFPLKGYMESKIGGRKENQDSCSFQDTPLGTLILVCDGMGGTNGGSTASSMAVQSIVSDFMNAEDEADPVVVITTAVNNANAAIIQAGQSNPSLAGMGTTLTLLLLTERCAYTTYVGDSRIYQLRDKEKVYRSFDHSVVFQLVKQGVITEEQARLSSQSNVIIQALGVKAALNFIVEELPYEVGDRFVLCTDGFWGSMSEPEILERLNAKKTLDRIVIDSTMEIDGKGVAKGGGHDNLTVALVEVKSDSKLKVKMGKKAKMIIAGLAALLLVSLVLNVTSAISVAKLGKQVKDGETQTRVDTLAHNEIAALKDSLAIVGKEIAAKQAEIDKMRPELEKLRSDDKKHRQEIDNLKARLGIKPSGATSGK